MKRYRNGLAALALSLVSAFPFGCDGNKGANAPVNGIDSMKIYLGNDTREVYLGDPKHLKFLETTKGKKVYASFDAYDRDGLDIFEIYANGRIIESFDAGGVDNLQARMIINFPDNPQREKDGNYYYIEFYASDMKGNISKTDGGVFVRD